MNEATGVRTTPGYDASVRLSVAPMMDWTQSPN